MSDQDWIDKLAIQEVVARYSIAVDNYDAEGWVNCFTDDGIFEISKDNPKIEFKGRDALTKFIKAHIANHLAVINSDEAYRKCSLAAFLYRSGKIYTLSTG